MTRRPRCRMHAPRSRLHHRRHDAVPAESLPPPTISPPRLAAVVGQIRGWVVITGISASRPTGRSARRWLWDITTSAGPAWTERVAHLGGLGVGSGRRIPNGSRGAVCDTGTSGSTSSAAAVRGCSACSCSSGDSGACTPRRRGSQRSGRLHGPSVRFLECNWMEDQRPSRGRQKERTPAPVGV